MNTKSRLLFVVSAAVLTLGASPAFAGAGGAAAAQQERGNRGGDRGDNGNRGGSENRGNGGGQRDNGNRGGDNNGGGQRDRGGDSNGWQNRSQAAPQAPAQQQQQQQAQRPGFANGGRNNDNAGFQGRMREAQAQAQNQGQQGRPDWANGRGQGDNNNRGFQGRVQAPQQPPQAPPAPRVQDQNRFGQNNGQQPNYRNDPRANQNMGNRNFGNNAPRPGGPGYNNNNIGPRNYGNNGSYARNTWASRNDWARYDRRPRTQVNIRIGSFFGGNYPSIASRYYGHSYIWYGSRSWTSWNRPWRIGYMLPPSMYCEPLPYDLYFDLPPPPIGYDYVMCDGDILIVGEDSGVVYDAILPY